MDYAFSDNHIWSGTTALMYNVDLTEYFYGEEVFSTLSIKEQYVNKVSDLGFEWKLHSASSWTSVSLKQTSNTYISSTSDIKAGLDSSIYDCYKYFDSYTPVGCKVLIMGLNEETTYDVRSYIVINGTKTTYNSESAETFESTNTITYDTPVYDSDAPAENIQYWQEILEGTPSALEDAVGCYNMFYTGSTDHFSPSTRYDPVGKWAADSSMTFNSFYTNENVGQVRSITVHELAHRHLYKDRNEPEKGYKAYIMQFMEFATGCPKAIWRWMSGHNYPVISSARYSFIEDCLVATACQLIYTYDAFSNSKKAEYEQIAEELNL